LDTLVEDKSRCSSRDIENAALDLDIAQFRVQQPLAHTSGAVSRHPIPSIEPTLHPARE